MSTEAQLRAEIEELRRENTRLKEGGLLSPNILLRSDSALLLSSARQTPGPEETANECKAVSGGKKALSIVIIGASGDLACKKTFPALFSLWRQDLIPKDALILGYARSSLELDKYKAKISSKFDGKRSTAEERKAFLDRCHYLNGSYENAADFKKLDGFLATKEKEVSGSFVAADRIFYFAIPPDVFVPVAEAINSSARSRCGFTRVIIEKPFGRDLSSARTLAASLGACFSEEETFRIDHYLGKEMVQNLMILRFANRVFEPLWNHHHIQAITITFKEEFGVQGRGGYFDNYGIIRDVMQNHLLQIVALIGMEPPVTLSAEDVRDEKVKFLRAVTPIALEDMVVGQYEADPKGTEPAYAADPTVPKGTLTPTYAAACLRAYNSRWAGMPFILKCGKGLDSRKTEVRIQFKTPHNNLFNDLAPNELVMRVQPNEALWLKMTSKEPGLVGGLREAELDFTLAWRFPNETKQMYDAYERLIWDVVRNDHNLFVRGDELVESWKIFTPVLHALDAKKVQPLSYPFGSRGPPEGDALASKYGFVKGTKYKWQPPTAPAAAAASHSVSAAKL